MLPPKKPIVLLPGLDGTGKLFSSLINALAPQKPLVIDYPPDEKLDYGALADFVISELPDTPITLICESFSGPVGARIAAKMPQRIAGLVFLGSFIASPRLRWLAPLNERITYRDLPASIINFAMLSKTSGASVDFFRSVVSSLRPELVRNRIRLALSCNEKQIFKTTKCPVLILQGTGDLILGRSSAQTIREVRPDAATVFLDGPHLVALTHPESVAEEIKKFAPV